MDHNGADASVPECKPVAADEPFDGIAHGRQSPFASLSAAVYFGEEKTFHATVTFYPSTARQLCEGLETYFRTEF